MKKFSLFENIEINKVKLGEYIGKGKDFNKKILNEYIKLFNFSNMRIDLALRALLFTFQIPGEAQIIDRIIDFFSKKYFEDNENNSISKLVESVEGAYYISFNIMILHTSLHNPRVNKKDKLTKESFKRNVKGLNNGKDFDEKLLDEIFDDIEKS